MTWKLSYGWNNALVIVVSYKLCKSYKLCMYKNEHFIVLKISPNRWHFHVYVKTLKYLVQNSCTLCNEKRYTSEKHIIILKSYTEKFDCVILNWQQTHFCQDRCKWGTMKSLDIKIALFCELFQKRFCFKDVQCKLSSWNVKKFRNFWFHCIINMKNNYHQAFIVVHLIIVTRNNIVWKYGPYNSDSF